MNQPVGTGPAAAVAETTRIRLVAVMLEVSPYILCQCHTARNNVMQLAFQNRPTTSRGLRRCFVLTSPITAEVDIENDGRFPLPVIPPGVSK